MIHKCFVKFKVIKLKKIETYNALLKSRFFSLMADKLKFTLCDFLLDVDECIESSNPCPDPSTICVNTDGAYECAKISADFSPHPPMKKDSLNHRDNTRPSLLICSAGYKPANDSGMKCIDVDECNEQLHSCDFDERCVNEIGSYRCEIFL